MRLADIQPRQSVRVCSVAGGDPLALRLMELGFTPGTAVTLLGAAPGGDPLLLLLRGFTLSLSRREAARILIMEDDT